MRTHAWRGWVAAAWALPLALFAAQSTAPKLHLIPTPRQLVMDEGEFTYNGQTGITLAAPDDEEDRFAARELAREVAKDFGLELKAPAAGKTAGVFAGRVGTRSVDEALAAQGVQFPRQFPGPFAENLAAQAYVLVVRSNGVVLAGGSHAGLFHGVQTLKQLLRANARGRAIPCCRIIDWPSLAYRCWQDDISRGPIATLPFLKRQVVTLSEFKLNALTLYTENVFKNPRHPKVAPADGLTADEARELCRFARAYHVELLGNHQAFGHYEKTLRLPEYAALRENEQVLTPAKEETYGFLKDVFDVIAPAYESPLFVINCDETFGLGDGPSKSMVKEMGLGGVYAYHIQRLYKILQAHGKTPLMWGDIALHHRDIVPRLPKDLIVLSWGYDARARWDDTIRPFTDMGFRFWVCPGVSSWVWIWPDHETASINIANYVRDGARLGAMGMLNTTWGDDGEQLFSYTWHPQVWAAEVSWLATEPGTKADPSLAGSGEAERSRRLAAFDQAFPRLFYGLTNDAVSQAIWKLDGLRKTRLGSGLNDALFWEDTLGLPQASTARAEKEIAQITRDTGKATSVFSTARPSARFNADGLEFAGFAAKRIAFLGTRAQARLATARVWAESADGKEKAVAALQGPILESRAALRDNVRELQQEYSRLWALENRRFWLDAVEARYDALAKQLDASITELRKAAILLESESVWPDAARLHLDLPGAVGRQTAAALVADDLGMAAAGWRWPEAAQRLPIVVETKKNTPPDNLLEVVLPRNLLGQPDRPARTLAVSELLPDGRQEVVPAQFDRLPDGSLRLIVTVPEPTTPGEPRRFLLYVGAAQEPSAPRIAGAVTAKSDEKGGYWVENDRYRAHLMPEGAHLYAFQVKQAGDLNVTVPGQTDWHGFSDAGPNGRKDRYKLSLEAAGPLLVRVRCTSEGGVEKVFDFRAGRGWYESFLEQAVGYYWDFDDVSVMQSAGATRAQGLFSDGQATALPKPGEISHARPDTLWGLKRRPDGLTLALITPGAPCTHRVGPGDSMGGVGLEGGGQARHFVTVCDVVAKDPAGLCNHLAAKLDLRNQGKVTVGRPQTRK